tara:strand:- start:148 stop:7515 length:7368 start_codon:yes stop_codon:yes gene_type:complete
MLEQLYQGLFTDGFFTGSFQDFQNRFEDEEFRKKLHAGIVGDGDFTGDFEKFEKTFLGKTQGSTVDSTMSQGSMGSQLGDGSLAQQENKGWFAQAMEAGAVNADLYDDADAIFDINSTEEARKLNDKELQTYIDLVTKSKISAAEMEELDKFTKSFSKYNAAGENWFMSTINAINENGGVTGGGLKGFAQAAVQSYRSMANEELAKEAIAPTLAAAGTGAAATAYGFGIGALPAGLAGMFGSMNYGLETIATFNELLEEEIKARGLEFTPESIRTVMADDEARARIKSLARKRGATIGTIEGATNLVGVKGAGFVLKAGEDVSSTIGKAAIKSASATTAGTIEAGGSGFGEFLGAKAAGKEATGADIILESFSGGVVKAPIDVATASVDLAMNRPTYEVNGKKVKKQSVLDYVNGATTAEEIGNLNVKVENDNAFSKIINERIINKELETQVDAKISNIDDRNQMVELEKQRLKAEIDSKKTGIQAVPGAKESLENIQSEMDNIISKYSSVDGRTKDVKARVKKAQQVREIKLEKTKQFAKISSEQLGFNPFESFKTNNDFVNNLVSRVMSLQQYEFDGVKVDLSKMTEDQINTEANRIADSAYNAGAVNIPTADGNQAIMINEEAAFKYKTLEVGSHEVLHGVLRGALANMDIDTRKKVIKDFKTQVEKNLGKNVVGAIEARLKNDYGDTIDLDTTDEWFTGLSDIIEDKNNNITYENNKGFFNNIKNKVASIFKKQTPYKNLSIETGEDAFGFMKEYSKNVKEGKLSESMVAFAKTGKATPIQEGAKFSKRDYTPSQTTKEINDLGKQIVDEDGTITNLEEEGVGNVYYEAEADNIVSKIEKQGYLDNLIASKYKGDVVPANFVKQVLSELSQHIKNYKPETQLNIDPAKRTGLFGWINPQIANKAAAVYNREYKGDEAIKGAKDVGETTKEGDVKIQVAAETDTRLKALETEDLSPAAQQRKKAEKAKAKIQKTSKLRKQIGIEEGGKLYNKIIDAAKQSLLKAYEAGTSARNIQRKLRDQASSYLFSDIKKFLGTKEYINNLKEFRVPIIDALFTADLVQIERLVPENERIFTKFERKLTRKADVEAAVDQGLLPAEALNTYDRDKSVNLYTKIMPSESKFIAFFDPPGSLPSKKDPTKMVRSGLKGTRKDTLARQLSGALSFDATLQVAQEPDVIEKRLQFAKINNTEILKDDISVLAATIHRDPSVKFAKGNVQILEDPKKKKIYDYGNKVARAYTVVEDIFYNNRLDYYQNLTPEQKKKHGGKKMVDIAIDQYLSRPIERLDGSRIVDIIRKSRKRGQKVSEAYEQYFITSANKAIKAITGTKAKVNVVVREGGIPDVHFQFNSTTVGLEIKMDTARGVSSTWKFDGTYSVNNPIETKAQESLIEQIKNTAKMKVFEGMDFVKGVTREQFETLKKHKHNFNKYVDVTADYLSWQYTNKAMPEYFINIGEAGAFYMLGDNSAVNAMVLDIAEKLGIPKLQGNYKLYSRLNTSSKFRKGDGRKPVTIRTDVQIDTKSKDNFTNGFSPVNLAVSKDMNNFVKELNNSLVSFSKGKNTSNIDNAVKFSRSSKNKSKGITILDFDDTLATTKSLVKYTTPDGKTGTLNAEQYANTYEDLLAQGYTFDFSDFSKVIKGKIAPLFNKAMKLQNKFGSKDMFILTARPADSAVAIRDFLKANGLNIPLKNITGLSNSTSEAKALWISEKVAEGYNDFYFADDALQNVQAVKNMLDQFDVKSKIQQAKVKFSKGMSKDFNKILETTKGVPAESIISRVRAIERGAKKGKYAFFLPPSAEDFKGLLYYFMGKGRQGDKDAAFLKKALIDPLNRAYTEFNGARQVITNDYRTLKKSMPEAAKKANQQSPDADFTYGDAIRVYLWNKSGFDIPGLTETEINKLVDMVTSDPQLQVFADKVGLISRRPEGYTQPGEYWKIGDIRNDLDDAINKVGRKEYFAEFIENTEEVFGKMVNGKLTGDNINKIESIYGTNFREALEDILYRTINGTSRPYGSNRLVNSFTNWINGSVGAVMFVNMRSALLQQMSSVNFINYGDNNVFKAAARFADQKQFWKDWVMLFNSDKLKQRRAGLSMDINANELTTYLNKSKSKTKAAINWLLRQGFKPTQISDSIAIANGGATFYRNRVNTYLKQGLSKKEAEAKAFNDFSEIAEETQQSARPDMASPQQASAIGKWFLNFLNTPMQYSRIIKKSMLDLINRRRVPNLTQAQSDTTNISRILYYGFAQNVIFYTLQTGLFAALFDDDDDEESEKFFNKKYQMAANSVVDGLLRGLGFGGAVVSTLKNMIVKFIEEDRKGYTGKPVEKVTLEMVNLSPVVGIKVRKVATELRSYSYDKDVIKHMETFDIDNPIWGITTGITEGLTNIPVNRLYRKTMNLRAATQDDIEAWQRLALISGWSVWNIGMQNEELERIKDEIKQERKKLKKKKKNTPRRPVQGGITW